MPEYCASPDSAVTGPARAACDGVAGVWLFGYGSLIWKVDFPFVEHRPATLHGWVRRYWQGSHDHRGTHAHPGRVVTLVPAAQATCAGMAYRVAPATFVQLDQREKNGYARRAVDLDFGDGVSAAGLAYIAEPGNAAWLGPAGEDAIAAHIAGSAGPSGSNRDYALNLATALRALGSADAHVFAVEGRLRELPISD